MKEPRYSGEEVLAMLAEYGIDPDDLPAILRREQVKRRDAHIDGLYDQIMREAAGQPGNVLGSITDAETLRGLLMRCTSSETNLRDEVRQPWIVDDGRSTT